MLKSLHVHDYLRIREAELELGDLNSFTGLNGAGKTSLADAIHHAITGQPVRGLTLPQHVRQGARSFAAGIALSSGLRFARRRAQSGAGTCLMEGTEIKAPEYDAAITREIGTSLPAAAAALRAGQILELAPAELQRLLVDLTGAALDAAAIRTALGPEIVGICERGGITIPASLDAFAASAAIAEAARQQFKRDLKAQEARLANLPAIADDVAAKLDAFRQHGDPVDLIGKRLASDRSKRDAALRSQDAARAYAAGGHEAKRAAAKARLDELATVPAAEAVDAESLNGRALGLRVKVDKVRGELGLAQMRVDEATRAAAGSRELPDGHDAAEAKLEKAQAEKAETQRAVDVALAEGKKRAELLAKAKAKAGGECESCGHEIAPGDIEKLELRVQQARDAWSTYKPILDETVAEIAALQKVIADTAAVRARIAADADLAKWTAKAAELRSTLTALEAELADIEKQLASTADARAAFDAFRRAEAEAAQVRAELARLDQQQPPAPPTDDAAALGEQLARGEQLLAAARAQAERVTVEQQIAATKAAIDDADAVAKALGPKGVRADLIAEGVRPFIDAANTALQELAPGYSVGIDAERFGFVVAKGTGEIVTPEALSDGERTRLLYVLQLAVVRLAGFRLLILDRGELIDEGGRLAVKKLMLACVAEGIQVISLTCKPATQAVPGVAMFVVEAGTVRQLGVREAA